MVKLPSYSHIMTNLDAKGFTLWFTGLPCSGKTTLSDLIEKELRAIGHPTEHLDGDVIRKELSKDLSFSKEDRATNIERAVFVASLLTRNGVAVVVSYVSPYRQMRDNARKKIGAFIEVYVHCPIEVCEKRDIKGMYTRARKGEIKDFTGVQDPYEEPLSPEIRVDTDTMDVASCTSIILSHLEASGHLMPRNPFPENALLTKAFETAAHFHRGQKREGGMPYITHPMAVAKILKDAGYRDEVVAAGLLHDVLEDTGCEREKMERAVGKEITGIVLQITDRDKTAEWTARKSAYIHHLKESSAEALAVSCADKTHNLICLAEGTRAAGDGFTKNFSGDFGEKIENYRNIYEVIAARDPSCRLLPAYRQHLEVLASLHRKA